MAQDSPEPPRRRLQEFQTVPEAFQTAPEAPNTAQEGSKNPPDECPKRQKICFFPQVVEGFASSYFFGPPSLQNGPRSAQDLPETAQKAPKNAPRRRQRPLGIHKMIREGPRTANEASQDGPRGDPEQPRKAPAGGNTNPEFQPSASTDPQKAQICPQDTPRGVLTSAPRGQN